MVYVDGDRLVFSDHRRYVPGGDTRRTDWTVYARSNELYVRQFETADELADILATNGDALVVTGHLHVPMVVRSGRVTEFTLLPFGPYPCGYTLLDVGRRGTVASFHSAATHARQAEALGLGRENNRVLFAATRMSSLPLVADWRSPLSDA